MKQLKDGGLAFYPTRWLHLVSGVLFTALFALFIYQMPPDQPFTYFIVAFWALAAFSFLKQGICPQPVCVVYPEKLAWTAPGWFSRKKYSLFWEEAEAFYLKEEWVRRGKNSVLVKVLVLHPNATASDPAERKLTDFYRLPARSREQLLREIAARGIARLEDVPDKKVPPFIKNLWDKTRF